MPPEDLILDFVKQGFQNLEAGQNRLQEGQDKLWKKVDDIDGRVPRDGLKCGMEDNRITRLEEKMAASLRTQEELAKRQGRIMTAADRVLSATEDGKISLPGVSRSSLSWTDRIVFGGIVGVVSAIIGIGAVIGVVMWMGIGKIAGVPMLSVPPAAEVGRAMQPKGGGQ